MPRFGIIGEGFTDQIVIERILQGYFGDQSDDLLVRYVQPPLDATSSKSIPAPGGWTLVFQSLKNGMHFETLEYNDYVILQVDTDVSEHPGYDVPWKDKDGNDSIDGLITRVRDKLIELMGQDFYARHRSRFLFAIAVHQTECWLLPLFFDNNKAAKITGCLDTVNHELKKRNERPLSTARGKDARRYQQVAREYARNRTLMDKRDQNPSLERFIDQLDAVRNAVSAPITSPESGDRGQDST